MEITVHKGKRRLTAPVSGPEQAISVARYLLAHGADRVTVAGAATREPAYAGATLKPGGARQAFPWPFGESIGATPVNGDAAELAAAQALEWSRAAGSIDAMAGAAAAGDVGQDILQAAQQTDDWIDQNIFGSKEGQKLVNLIPYGNLITAAHKVRREAQGSPVAEPPAESPPGAPRPELAAAELLHGAHEAAIVAMAIEAQRTTRKARKGDPEAMTRVRALKEAAAAGDPEARRRWRVYTLVSDEDQREIDRLAQGVRQ